MSDATGDTYWTFGDGVHLTTQQTPQGTVGYAYDADGRRSTMALAGTGSWVYGYDMAGRLVKLQSPTDGATTYAYDAADRLMRKTKGSGETPAWDLNSNETGDTLNGQYTT